MRKTFLLCSTLLTLGFMSAQVSISNNEELDPQATFDVRALSNERTADGILIPRITSQMAEDMPSNVPVQESTLIYITENSTTGGDYTNLVNSKGFYYYDPTIQGQGNEGEWVKVNSNEFVKHNEGFTLQSILDFEESNDTIRVPIGENAIDLSFYKDNEGLNLGASGENSFSAVKAYAGGKNSIAMGYFSKATQDYSASIGYLNEVTARQSSAYGALNKVSGQNACAFGSGNMVNSYYSSAIGTTNTLNGIASSAIGYSNNVTARLSHATGYSNSLYGNQMQFAFGASNTSSENASESYIFGRQNEDNNAGLSFLIGDRNKVEEHPQGGVSSFLIGSGNTSIRGNAIGNYNMPNGAGSIAIGNSLTTSSENEIALGVANVSELPNGVDPNSRKSYLLTIGSDLNENVFEMTKGGLFAFYKRDLTDTIRMNRQRVEKGFHVADSDGVINYFNGAEWSKSVRISDTVPTSPTSPCIKGEVVVSQDEGYSYICYKKDRWTRLSSENNW